MIINNKVPVSRRFSRDTGTLSYMFSCGFKEPLIKSFRYTESVVSTHISDGFSSVGNDGFAFNQQFLNESPITFPFFS